VETGPRRGFWRSTFCGDLDNDEEIGTWGAGWKRFWRPCSRKSYWNAALHLTLLNFPFVSVVEWILKSALTIRHCSSGLG
jgi:hypothetical protein